MSARSAENSYNNVMTCKETEKKSFLFSL